MSYTFNNRVLIDQEQVSGYDEIHVVQRTPILEVIPFKGVSAIRDIVEKTGTANAVDGNTAEIVLYTGSTANSVVELHTAERGRYMPGYGAQVGVGIRFANADPQFTNGAYLEWGYEHQETGIEPENGLVFGRDSGGTYVKVTRDGIAVEKTYQTAWNLDRLDGTGPSRYQLDLNTGNIYHIDFTWYGYGVVEWGVVIQDPSTLRQRKIICHVYKPSQQTSLKFPNLPIGVLLSNGNSTSNNVVYVAGRQFSVVGPFSPDTRIVSDYVASKGTDGTLRPLLSAQSKNTEKDRSIAKKIEGFELFPVNKDILVRVMVNSTISNTANFKVPALHANSEVSTIFDITANNEITDGHCIYTEIVTSSTNRNQTSESTDKGGLFITIPENQPVTIAVQTLDGGSGTVAGIFRIREEW